ncbi:Bcr/CflA family multidrug efflux MFS transporter [Salinisphaera sp. USBA-960]|uniref:Bcr/CflA family multidrug efflux MFS transporter n=1 Tax=Salinisphaera orenii TaxID=856731 RepID=UPI000DBE3ABD|nr:Bcr/CflA family multidrug efflux MFS transporter [Salifodinibacter halophilus]NNC25959.1 Bcr/CflA family multidrug efflux MFS transporter [Salifodinibacter halophilus]
MAVEAVSDVKRLSLIVVLGAITAIGPLSIDTYLPAMPALAQEFGVDASDVQYTLSVFFIGLAAGQLTYGPLSDRYGRMPILYGGLSLYLVASVLCAVAGSVEAFTVARLFEGFGAASAPVMGRAIVRDRFAGNEAASVMSFVVMVMASAPLVAPMLGSALLTLASWRGIFVFISAYALLGLFILRFLLAESHPIENRVRDHSLAAQYLGYISLIGRPPVMLFLICGSLMFGALFSYVAASAFVYISEFGVDRQLFGLYFGANVCSMLLGTWANGRLVRRYGYRRLLGFAVANTQACGLVLLATTLTGWGGFWGVAVPLFFLLATVGIAGANTVAGLLDLVPDRAGAASALFGVCQFSVGSLTSWWVGALGGDAVAMAIVMASSAGGAVVAYIGMLVWGIGVGQTTS